MTDDEAVTTAEWPAMASPVRMMVVDDHDIDCTITDGNVECNDVLDNVNRVVDPYDDAKARQLGTGKVNSQVHA